MRALVAALLSACLLLAACPESVHPVSDPAGAAHDPALSGTWHGVFDGDAIYLHVGRAERGLMRAVTVEHERKDGGIKVEHYVAFPSRLDKLALVNVRPVNGDGTAGYSLFKYEAGKDRLTLWMTSFAAVREDIKAGKLGGIAEDGKFGETRITAPSAELAAWLRAADPKRLFDKPLVFRRVAP